MGTKDTQYMGWTASELDWLAFSPSGAFYTGRKTIDRPSLALITDLGHPITAARNGVQYSCDDYNVIFKTYLTSKQMSYNVD